VSAAPHTAAAALAHRHPSDEETPNAIGAIPPAIGGGPSEGTPNVRTLSTADVEAVADAILDRLDERRIGPLYVDAAEAARTLSVSVDYVREHAAELGGQRVGSGPRAPLRFEVRALAESLTPCSASRGTEGTDTRTGKPKARRRTRTTATSAPDLLPITPPRYAP
jgi:hypothetical protein